jgi:hypothetical protein
MSGRRMEPIRVRAFRVQIRNQKADTLRHPVLGGPNRAKKR